ATYNGRSAERSRIAVPKTVDAVYEGGVLRLLSPLDLPEHQRVRVTVDVAPDERPNETLRAWLGVYAGLAEEDVAEVAAIARVRRATTRHERAAWTQPRAARLLVEGTAKLMPGRSTSAWPPEDVRPSLCTAHRGRRPSTPEKGPKSSQIRAGAAAPGQLQLLVP